MAGTQDLSNRIDAAFKDLENKRKKFQSEETQKQQQWEQRLGQLGKVFDSLREVWKPPLELLIQKFGDKVVAKPALTPSMRSVSLEFQSEVARVRLRFQATTDPEIRRLILNYDLEILPILTQFESHSELDMPLDAVDREALARWIDDRIVSFVSVYFSLYDNQYYLKDQMVEDPVTNTRFPKLAAGAKLERDGRTYYFVSEETRRTFEERTKGAAK